jgi:hypothetical protein
MSISETAPPSLQSKLMAFVAGPQGQSIIRRALSGSGVAGVWLIHHGFPEADLGSTADIIVMAAPFVLTEVWAQITKTHAAIIGQAANILAARQPNGRPIGTIVVGPGATDGVLAAVGNPALANVVSSGSAAAMIAASPTPNQPLSTPPLKESKP